MVSMKFMEKLLKTFPQRKRVRGVEYLADSFHVSGVEIKNKEICDIIKATPSSTQEMTSWGDDEEYLNDAIKRMNVTIKKGETMETYVSLNFLKGIIKVLEANQEEWIKMQIINGRVKGYGDGEDKLGMQVLSLSPSKDIRYFVASRIVGEDELW